MILGPKGLALRLALQGQPCPKCKKPFDIVAPGKICGCDVDRLLCGVCMTETKAMVTTTQQGEIRNKRLRRHGLRPVWCPKCEVVVAAEDCVDPRLLD